MQGSTMKRNLFVLGVAFALALSAASASAQTLKTVKDRGSLICGVTQGLAGFSLPDDKGNWTGLDVDYCRAIAATIFNDPSKVKFTPLSTKDRFEALKSGEIDLLARNSTWTLSRDVLYNFIGVNYYDGQGFMLRKSLKLNSALELNGASICTQTGTTTELNLADYFRSNNLKYEVNGSEVILSGQVVSDHSVTKDDIQKAVGRISGVTKVVNNIEILPLSGFDDQIRRAEYRTIFSTSDLG